MKIVRTISSLLLILVPISWNNVVLASTELNYQHQEVKAGKPDTEPEIFENSIHKYYTAIKQRDFSTALKLYSRDTRSQFLNKFLSALYLVTGFRSLDRDSNEENKSLKAELETIEDRTGVKLQDVTEASLEVQIQYLDALQNSIGKSFNIKENVSISGLKAEILSLENNTALIGFTNSDDYKFLFPFIKQDGQWLIATQEEIEVARRSQDSPNYIYPYFLPSTAILPYVSNKKYRDISPDWHKFLPPMKAEAKEIQVDDIVIAFVDKKFADYRVISLKKTNNGDVAELINREHHIFRNVPLVLLHKAENFIDRSKKLQVGDAVFVSDADVSIFRVSNIERGQIAVKYPSFDRIEEATPKNVILPLPKTGYVFRQVVYRYDGDIEVGTAIAESASKVWIDPPSPSLGIIAVSKADAKPIELPKANLSARKVWTTTYNSIREVQILRVIEPGLLYEIDEKSFDGKYRLLPFNKISIEEPSL